MRARFSQSPIALQAEHRGPALIAIGLSVFLATAWWPAAPLVGAMSLVALGATLTTINRRGSANALRTAIAIHLFVYASLYLLLICAICDAARRGPQDGLTLLQAIDFGLSAGVMTFVVRLCVAAMAGGG